MQGPCYIKQVFSKAADFDSSLANAEVCLEGLIQKSITAQAFTSESLFENLAKSMPSLFYDYPAPYTALVDKKNPKQFIINYLSNLDDDFKYKVHRKLGELPKHLSISELINSWRLGNETLRITNIHTRKTAIPEILDPDALCPFNLLNVNCPDINSLEMMTLMVGTSGSFTDSHSDDADVNNHCIAGRKLWLVWDCLEGVKAGIQDTERQVIAEDVKAKFDLQKFLQLKSSAWFVVDEGQTLFLPGNYTHKVITLENYLGVGGFFVSYPSLLNTYQRWLGRLEEYDYKEPLYRRRKGAEFAQYIESSLNDVASYIGRSIKHNTIKRKNWGLDYVDTSLQKLKKNLGDNGNVNQLLRCQRILESLAN